MLPEAVFYPLGHPRPYTYAFHCRAMHGPSMNFAWQYALKFVHFEIKLDHCLKYQFIVKQESVATLCVAVFFGANGSDVG
jgi:hypothetical protein